METGLKIALLGLAGLGAYAIYQSRRTATLPPGSPPPMFPPPVTTPPVQREAPRPPGGGLENVPPVRQAVTHSINPDSPEGNSPATVGDRLRLQGAFPSGFDVNANPMTAVRQLSSTDFVFQTPGLASVNWARNGVTRTITFTIS